MRLLKDTPPIGLNAAAALLVVFALLVSGAAQAQASSAQPAAWSHIYFIAATPTGLAARRSYPASLYALGPGRTLRLVRSYFKAGGHFSDFADDLHGTIYLASRKGFYVVHTADPQQAHFVPVTNFADTSCWGAVFGPGVPSAAQYCHGRRISRVAGKANQNSARVSTGSWAAFKSLQFGGENGGPFQQGPPRAAIDGANLVMPYGARPEVVLAHLPPRDRPKGKLQRSVSILASTDRYLVIWIRPAKMGAFSPTRTVDSARTPPHTAPLHVLVLHKRTHHWQTLVLPTAVSTLTRVPVRIFGNWLVTTEMDWSPPAPHQAKQKHGLANLQKTPMHSATGGISAAYDRRFLDIHIPGKLAIWNLADGRRLTLNTHQEDSEVLLIEKNGTIVYRVNSNIYAAKIKGDKIGAPALLAHSPNAANIHWAFIGKTPSAQGK